MFFRKLSIILYITLLVFSSRSITVSALYNSNPDSDLTINLIIKDLENIDNKMLLLLKSIPRQNLDKNDLKNSISHIYTLINDLNVKTSYLPKENKNVSMAINSILSIYQLSLASAEKYLNNSQPEDLLDSSSYFSTAYYSLSNIRNVIYQAAKQVAS
ncbi:hypothetical protein [Paraclostridium bifermentans]|uniref:hypothetical protein n=1 Tax=Paraclostridium bifermentans TaxID=1490 RepID=UPI001C80DF11|nr:hypothetical protein [Paraclostridium bifermentans]GIM32733.1 hypothetical protein PAGU1678_20030 [Paraclostridium bifermentans subsp. muricolitidis]